MTEDTLNTLGIMAAIIYSATPANTMGANVVDTVAREAAVEDAKWLWRLIQDAPNE